VSKSAVSWFKKAMIHKHEYRVYYEDTDAGGIMYHAQYISWCERGRAEYLREVGLNSSGIVQNDNVMFVVRHINADYFKPARLDDLLRVETAIQEMKNSSFIMKQSIFCQDSMLFSMTVTIVCIDNSGRPVRIPERLRTILGKDQE
jgi:acyl-CoA thioester hydrolase